MPTGIWPQRVTQLSGIIRLLLFYKNNTPNMLLPGKWYLPPSLMVQLSHPLVKRCNASLPAHHLYPSLQLGITHQWTSLQWCPNMGTRISPSYHHLRSLACIRRLWKMFQGLYPTISHQWCCLVTQTLVPLSMVIHLVLSLACIRALALLIIGFPNQIWLPLCPLPKSQPYTLTLSKMKFLVFCCDSPLLSLDQMEE